MNVSARPQRWLIDPLVTVHAVGGSVFAYHAGSGNTHLLDPLSAQWLQLARKRGAVVFAPEEGDAFSPVAGAGPPVASTVLTADIEAAFARLQRAGLIRAEAGA